ncbi:hypothetical protein [Coraliomargarita parva]|uniref:hypothetical protein n=1 Tax=Coraliomargarita parva TaxID=3014050 RepID=UPI0022B34584|nr:hypothetical protein [Coraliomargarita parva]
MKEIEEFENWVDQVKTRELPKCPESVAYNVLRRVRNEASAPEQSDWAWLLSLLPNPGYVAAMLLVAVSLTSSITFMATKRQVTTSRSQVLASAALDFEFFSQTELLHFNNK